jgi:hypothetical protein
MTSLGKSAIVDKLDCINLNAKNFNPPLTGVLNPLASDLNCNGAGGPYSLNNIKNLKTNNITFTTINGAPIGSGTLDNPLLFDLDGNGAGGPYSFENIGVGECATVTATGGVTCNGLDATSGTYSTTQLTTTDNSIKGAVTVTGLIKANGPTQFQNGFIVNGDKTLTGSQKLTVTGATECDNYTGSLLFPTTASFPPIPVTFGGLLSVGGDVEDSGKITDEDLEVNGDMSATNLLMNTNDQQRAILTTPSIELPIINALGTQAVPLDLSSSEGGTLDLGSGGKGVVYAWSGLFGPEYPITFTVQLSQSNPLQKGKVEISSQLYQTAGVLTPALTKYFVKAVTTNTFKVTTFYDAPSSATDTHRITVIYTPDSI